MMLLNQISEIQNIGTIANVQVAIGRSIILPAFARKITKIKCFAVAQEAVKPYSIYPVIFKLYSNDVRGFIQDIAVPHVDYIVDLGKGTILSSDVNIVSCEINPNIVINGGEQFQGSATQTKSTGVAPLAFYIIEYEVL